MNETSHHWTVRGKVQEKTYSSGACGVIIALAWEAY